MPTARVKWTECEDAALRRYMQDKRLAKNWALLSHMPELKSRARCSIRARWMNVLRPGLVTGAFSKEDDAVISEHVRNKGVEGWGELAIKMNRNEASLRTHWMNHLRPGLVTGAFSKEEDAVISEHVRNKGAEGWGELAIKMNRSEASIRTHWMYV